jgi:uncharacterized damage-inducible protein DinB
MATRFYKSEPGGGTMTSLLEQFAHWDQVRTGLLQTLDQFTSEEMTFTPHSKSWPIGQILLHIASAEAGWIHYILAGELASWPAYPLKDHPNRQDIRACLETVHTKTKVILGRLTIQDMNRQVSLPWDETQVFTIGWIIWHVLEHEIHHRGELSLVLGLLGRDGLDV